MKKSDVDDLLKSSENKINFERALISSRVTVVIVKDKSMPNGYRIQTGFLEL